MTFKKFITIGVVILLTLAIVSGCAGQSASTPDEIPILEASAVPATEAIETAPEPVELLIGAAASLTDVNQELAEIYEDANPHVTLTFTFASSGTLQSQIEEGAPMDIFMSAALAQMHNLEEQGLIYGDSMNLLRNSIALIVPADSSLDIGGFADVAGGEVEVIGIGDPESVPGGTRAQEVFTSLDIFDEVFEMAVLAPDIRTVLTWVEIGEVDAGVVFMTDAITSDQVRVVEVADSALHAPSINPVGIVEDSLNIAEAQRFIDFLFSDEAAAIFVQHGFSMYE